MNILGYYVFSLKHTNKWRLAEEAPMKSTTNVFCMKVYSRIINNSFIIPENQSYLHTTADKLSGPVAYMILN